MTTMRRLAGAMMAAMLAFQASAANAVCLTEPEFKAAVRFLAPDLVAALTEKCGAVLPANAYLRQSGAALIARYRAVSAGSWPEVQALIKRVPEAKIFASFDEATARGMVAGLVKEGLEKEKIPAGDCAIVDGAFAALDPLPAENFIALAATLAHLDKGKADPKDPSKRRAPLLCPGPAR